MRYRVTLESGPASLVDDVAYRHFLRQAVRRRHGTTRVRGGYVVTLPAGRMVALIAEKHESTHASSPGSVVRADLAVS